MILVTGGTGFVGRRLVALLAASDVRVRVLTRTPGRAEFPAAVDVVRGDLSDAASLVRAVCDVRAVVHLAACVPAGSSTSDDLQRVNVTGTTNLARASIQAGVGRIVHVSSAGVYGDAADAAPRRETDPPHPGTAYERSKLAGEESLRAELAGSSVGWTIVRPAGIYGAGRAATVQLFREVARRRVWLHGPVPVTVHPTHVDDVTGALRLMLDREGLDGETFNIGGERPLDYCDLIAMIGARMGHTPLQPRAPRWTGLLAGAAAGAWRAAAAMPPAALSRLAQPRVNRAVDISKARQRIGFTPISLERGLDDTAASFVRRRPCEH